MAEYLRIGKIVKAHGVGGEVYVYPLTDDAARFSLLTNVFVDINNILKKQKIEYVRIDRNRVTLKFSGVNDRDSVESILNKYILIDRADAVTLPEHSYFISDIIGCEVFEEDGSLLGNITDVLQTGGNDVYIVTDPTGKEILVPALKSVFIKMDIEHKKITARLPEGLVENEI